MPVSPANGSSPGQTRSETLSEEHHKGFRHNLAHLSLPAVRDFYAKAYQDCRLIYNRIPSPRQGQTVMQALKQLWKWP